MPASHRLSLRQMLWSKQAWPTLKTEDATKTLLPDLGGGVTGGAASPYR